MADTESRPCEAAAGLPVTRILALSGQDLLSAATCLLARYPDTFPPPLDDALSSVSPEQGG